jgi:hypothetical protein
MLPGKAHCSMVVGASNVVDFSTFLVQVRQYTAVVVHLNMANDVL